MTTSDRWCRPASRRRVAVQPREGTCKSLKIGPSAILLEFRAADQSYVWLHDTSILLVFCALSSRTKACYPEIGRELPPVSPRCPRRYAPMGFGNISECPSASVRDERSAQPKIPHLPLQERFKPQPASVAYGIRVASPVVRIHRTDARPGFDFCLHSPNLRTADEPLAIRKRYGVTEEIYPFRSSGARQASGLLVQGST